MTPETARDGQAYQNIDRWRRIRTVAGIVWCGLLVWAVLDLIAGWDAPTGWWGLLRDPLVWLTVAFFGTGITRVIQQVRDDRERDRWKASQEMRQQVRDETARALRTARRRRVARRRSS